MTRLFSAAIAAAILLLAIGHPAFAATIELGAAFGSFEPTVNAIVSGLVVAAVGWVLWILKNKLSISIDDSMRDALQTFLQRQASSLVAKGAVTVQGLKIDVKNDALAIAANTALSAIPGALNHFGLTPDKLGQMIVDKIPHVPSVAAVAAAQVKPSA